MPPNTPLPTSNPVDDNVWISRQEYDRLRLQSSQPVIQQPVSTINQTISESNKVLQSRRRWQAILGGLLALGLYFSVASGQAANLMVLGAIVIFGGMSLSDYMGKNKSDVVDGVVVPKVYKSNPFKIMAIVLLVMTVLPAVLLVGFFFLVFGLGGGDVGS